MLNLLISILIRLFFQRPPGITPGQRAGDQTAVFEQLEASAYGRRFRRPTPTSRTSVVPQDDFEFSL